MYEHLNKFYILGVNEGGTPIATVLTDSVTVLLMKRQLQKGLDASENRKVF